MRKDLLFGLVGVFGQSLNRTIFRFPGYSLRKHSDQPADEQVLRDLLERLRKSSHISTLLGTKLQQQKIQLNYADTAVMLHADVQHFQLLLIELLNNALLHAFDGRDSGCIELRIRPGETHFELLYQDDGVGFAYGSPDKVFEPFFTTSRSSGHTGLGLNLVYNLVTVALQGEIKALPVSQGFALCCRLPNRWLATQPR